MWSSDLWSALLSGLKEGELTVESWSDLLNFMSNPGLQSAHAYDIANLLYTMVRDGGKPFTLDLLERSNNVALQLWQSLDVDSRDEEIDDWISRAINRPAGIIVEFWLNGLSMLVRGTSEAERIMPENYRHWFTLVVQDVTSKGGMGRSLLAGQTAFLFGLDREWTLENIIPLFSEKDRQKFAQAWDGFLVCGRLNTALVDTLLPAFIAAIPRLSADIGNRSQRFIEFYTALAVFHVSDPTEQLLPALFQQGSLDDRLAFASHLKYFLRQMQQPAKQQLWNGWLRRYWQGRLQGVLTKLEDTEIRNMLEWLPHLGEAFPEAVDLVVRGPAIRVQHSNALYELRKSELVTQFPNDTAELLIYLSNCTISRHASSDLSRIETCLPPIPAELRKRLDEAFAFAGVKKRPN